MTAPDPTDTVIEQAAKVAREMGVYITNYAALRLARALHAAGLLVDPASTGSRMVDQLIREREECKAAWKRAEAERDAEHRKYAQEADRAEALESEVAELREKWLAFTSTLGFGNNKTEPAAELAEMVDPIEQAFSDASDHQECAVTCELCGERLAAKDCDECHGSGCVPNSALAYLECGTCAGAGKVHEGCVEKSYAELANEVAELRATVARVRALADKLAHAKTVGSGGANLVAIAFAQEIRAAIDGAGEQHG